jgi:hypothetical protein
MVAASVLAGELHRSEGVRSGLRPIPAFVRPICSGEAESCIALGWILCPEIQGVARRPQPVKGLLGDMAISRAGHIYVSEGNYGAILRLRPGARELERIDVAGEFASPQTPALSRDENTLYVPDYVRGIAALTLATGYVTWLRPADDIALSGIDGLYRYRDSFPVVQNGTTPVRIMRFSADLRKQQVLEANTPELGEPTHGTIVGDAFYLIANSGWDAYDEQGKKKPGSKPVESTVRKILLQ